jgi:hypothetical protein
MWFYPVDIFSDGKAALSSWTWMNEIYPHPWETMVAKPSSHERHRTATELQSDEVSHVGACEGPTHSPPVMPKQ